MKKIALCLIFLFVSVTVAAAAQKIGYVNLQKVLLESNQGKVAKQQIGEKIAAVKQKISSEEKALQQMQTDLEKKASMLKPEALKEEQNAFRQRVAKFQRMAATEQKKVQNEDAKVTQRILNEVVVIVKQVAKNEGYSLVLEQSEGSVLYGEQAYDITAKVIAAYNKSK